MTDAEVDLILKEMRANREQWLKEHNRKEKLYWRFMIPATVIAIVLNGLSPLWGG